MRVRRSTLKAWHMHSRLPYSFVTAKGTVLFTAPPALPGNCVSLFYI